MVASARVAYLARRATDYGVEVEPPTVDLARVRERKRGIVASFRGGAQRRLERTAHLILAFGHARFVGPREIEVTGRDGIERWTADTVVVNTGCRPATPPLEGLESVPYLDSTSVMELATLPERLLVLGGGYIGLEFAQMFRRFGAEVTVVQRGRRVLAREDEDVADAVAEILRDDGIEVLLESEAVRVERLDRGIELVVRTAGVERKIGGSHLLVAVGRTPNTDDLGLDVAGVATDRHGYIEVDERLRTSVESVYAAGDCKGGPAFTHISYDDYRVLKKRLLEGVDATIGGRLVPSTVFIDPQLGRVGLREHEARADGLDIRIAKMPMAHVARALEMDESRGFMKAVVDASTGRILGFTVLGVEGGELMAVVEVAMMGKLHHRVLRDAIFAHPTLAESLNNLFAQLD
jgi:pyruvate/2-oxoglutarate dehydrogenase complex dihydrolipoamide dehydrogenase (E3) component